MEFDFTLKSYNEFRKIFDYSPLGMLISDLDGNIKMSNLTFQKMLGYSDLELNQMKIGEISPTENLSKKKDLFNTALLQKSFLKTEKHYLKKDGHLVLTNLTLTFIKDENENPVFAIGLVEDITQKKRYELEKEVFYQISEAINSTTNLNELLKSIYNSIKSVISVENCFIALYDEKTNEVEYPFFVDKYDEFPSKETLGRGSTAYVLRTGKPLLLSEELYNELIKSNEIEMIGTPSKSWLGTPLTIHNKVKGVIVVQSYNESKLYSEKELTFLSAVGNQISFAIERKLNEENHLKTEQRLTLIWEKSADGFRLTDEKGIIVMVNKAFCQIVEKSQVELIDNPMSIIYQKDEQEHIISMHIQRFAERTVKTQFEKEMTLWNEKKVWFEVSNSFLEIENQPTLLLSIFRDITQRKKLELQLLKSQTLDSIGRLAGGIAHDFNNMLTAIIGNAEMIGSFAKDDEKIIRFGNRIKQAAQRGSDLARQLLTFARMETYDLKPIRVKNIIDETVKLLEHTFQKTVDIETFYQNDLPMVNADVGRLQQVFLNLCVNARDAMPNGGILVIDATLEHIENGFLERPSDISNGDFIKISISDSGLGMDEDTKLKIFEPFFTTKQQGKGTGLGLAIVYGIIKNHKGFITVDSKLNVGTTFNIFLPVSDSKIESTIDLSEEKIIGGKENVLIVDDEDIVLDVVKEMLISLNYNVITAESGIAAIELYKLRKDEINLVITDMAMPKMNGLEALIIMKKINPEVKIILVSGLLESDTHQKIIEEGVSGFLQKPYRLEDLAKKVREVLDKK